MERTNTHSLRDDLVHGHSRLVWLMDDIDAHLAGLAAEPLDRELLEEEFLTYSRAFAEELREHIDEEEGDLFPLVRSIAGGPEMDSLVELQRQHQQLLIDLGRWGVLIEELTGAPDERRAFVIGALCDHSRTIREHLVIHSKHERSFLLSVEDRLQVACLTA